MDYYENENLEFRVDHDERCLKTGKIDKCTVKCTREENHEGKHACQLENGTLLGRF
jgi:hypothetical protein